MYKALLYLIMPNAGQVKHGRGHAFDVLEELTGVYYEDGPSGGASDQAAHLLARMTLKEPLVNHGWYAQKSLYTLPLTSSPPNSRKLPAESIQETEKFLPPGVAAAPP